MMPPDIFSGLFKFTVVRNPWARAISGFFMPLRWLRRPPHCSIEEFRDAIQRLPTMASNLKLNGVPGKLDMVLRFETLETDFAALVTKLGIEAGPILPHKNKGRTLEDWQNYYFRSPELIDFVGKLFAEDIQLFGYNVASLFSKSPPEQGDKIDINPG